MPSLQAAQRNRSGAARSDLTEERGQKQALHLVGSSSKKATPLNSTRAHLPCAVELITPRFLATTIPAPRWLIHHTHTHVTCKRASSAHEIPFPLFVWVEERNLFLPHKGSWSHFHRSALWPLTLYAHYCQAFVHDRCGFGCEDSTLNLPHKAVCYMWLCLLVRKDLTALPYMLIHRIYSRFTQNMRFLLPVSELTVCEMDLNMVKCVNPAENGSISKIANIFNPCAVLKPL